MQTGPVRRLILLVPLAGAALVGAARLGRRSGVTDEEVAAPLPGDDVVPDARVVIDRATTLAASARAGVAVDRAAREAAGGVVLPAMGRGRDPA